MLRGNPEYVNKDALPALADEVTPEVLARLRSGGEGPADARSAHACSGELNKDVLKTLRGESAPKMPTLPRSGKPAQRRT